MMNKIEELSVIYKRDELITLVEASNKTYREIGELLGVSRQAVHDRLYKSKKLKTLVKFEKQLKEIL